MKEVIERRRPAREMSDKPNHASLPDWVEELLPAHQQASPKSDPPHAPETQDTAAVAGLPAMTPLQSTNLESAGHDGQSLWVKFLNGTLYRYPTASQDLHKGLVAANSAGSFFHQHIKSAHKGEKVL